MALHRQAGCCARQIIFGDSDKISAFAVDAVLWAYEKGIVKGAGNSMFDPAGSSTRAATAQLMMKYFETYSL